MEISASLVRDTGGKGEFDMNKDVVYTDAPVGLSKGLFEGEIVSDFLPQPDQLVRKVSKTKVTITLDNDSIDFFKKYAKKHNIKYQTMINKVLYKYAQKHEPQQGKR
jgi:hypothetical protein